MTSNCQEAVGDLQYNGKILHGIQHISEKPDKDIAAGILLDHSRVIQRFDAVGLLHVSGFGGLVDQERPDSGGVQLAPELFSRRTSPFSSSFR